MGYALHITRKANRLDENLNSEISLEEWKTYVGNDEELRLNNFAEMTNPIGEVIRIEREGLSYWQNHPQSKNVWLSWFDGEISVNKPDDATIRKMLEIANHLKAEVRGDGGEIY